MKIDEVIQKGTLRPPGVASAPGGTFSCTALAVGPHANGNVYVFLREDKNGGFANWYVVEPGSKHDMLTTALAAITSDLSLLTDLSTTDGYGTVKRMYINRL